MLTGDNLKMVRDVPGLGLCLVLFLFMISSSTAQSWRGREPKRNLRGSMAKAHANSPVESSLHAFATHSVSASTDGPKHEAPISQVSASGVSHSAASGHAAKNNASAKPEVKVPLAVSETIQVTHVSATGVRSAAKHKTGAASWGGHTNKAPRL